MARWLSQVLVRVHELAGLRAVRFTLKARRELTHLDLGLDEEDARDVLMGLCAGDSAGRLVSGTTGEWLYVFKPQVAGTLLCVKLVLRAGCVVVSFHEDDGDNDEDDE